MKQSATLLNLICAIVLIFNSGLTEAKEKAFDQKQVLKDIDFLYQSLIETHFNPYAYISQKQLKRQYQSLKKSIDPDLMR